jgi:hypothetical protein
MRASPPASPHPDEIHWLCMAALASYVVPCHGYSRRPQHLLVNFRRPWPIASPNNAFGTARFLQHQVPTHLLLIRSQKAAQRPIVMSALHNYQILRRILSRATQLTLLRPFPDQTVVTGDILMDSREHSAHGAPILMPFHSNTTACHHATSDSVVTGYVPHAVCIFVDGCSLLSR